MSDARGGRAARDPGSRPDDARAAELASMEELFDALWPLPRSLTGDGVRETHRLLSSVMPLETFEVPSGTRVFDWTVPPEWRVNEAYVVAPDGRRALDFAESTLRLVGYSAPFRGRLSLEELQGHLHSLPDLPDAVPYVTSYYRERWGFCLSERERRALPPGEYEVVVDTELFPGSLTYSHAVLPGETGAEVLLTSYTCHPALANNELSGPLTLAFLHRRLASWPRRRLSYRFVLAPETIGALAYLHAHGEHLRRAVVAGYVVTCTGGPGGLTYKRSRDPSLADRAAEHVLAHLHEPHPPRIMGFTPVGSDERQYCSPGFRLPVGSLMRARYGTYREYHTSLDDKAFMDLAAVQRTLDAYEAVCRVLDGNETLVNLSPYGEPRLGERGLYPDLAVGGSNHRVNEAVFWVLNLCDGENDLLAVAERSGLPFDEVRAAADRLTAVGLLAPAPARGPAGGTRGTPPTP